MNVTGIFLDIVIVLLAAKVAAEIAERLGVPAIVGEIVAGISVGPSVLGILEPNKVLEVLGELGVVLLLLEVGLELSIGDLRAVGRSSLTIAVIGVVVPVSLGIATGLTFGESRSTALFLGTALAATSVGITARVLSDLGALARVEGRSVLGAAVADDVLGLVLLTIVTRLVTAGTLDVLDVLEIVAVALAFLVLSLGVGTRVGPRVFHFVDRNARSTGTFAAIALAFTLVFASLAEAAELAPIVGAFAAGVALSGSAPAARVRRELAPVGHVLIPVFFLQIGVHAELAALGDLGLVALIAVLLVAASLGKLASGLGLSRGAGDRLLVGLGMLPRGEVGLIFASIGLANGVLDADLYAALVAVVLFTTLLAPPLLRARVRALDARQRAHVAVLMPTGGWLAVSETVDLVAPPSDTEMLLVALDAARLVDRAPPSEQLLDWLGRVDLSRARWDRRATTRMVELLRDGSSRSWRFLEAAGILERALPELATALRRRRDDPLVLDPAHVLRFPVVDALRDVVAHDQVAATVFERLRYPEQPVLAALVLSVRESDAAVLARALADRLRLGARGEESLVALVNDANLMRAAAIRLDGLDEEPVLVLATHLASSERARALYLVSRAIGTLEPWELERLDELLGRLLAALDRPELTGPHAATLLDARRAAAVRLTRSPDAARRARDTPRAHLLAQPPDVVARHATLLDPSPRRRSLRVYVTPITERTARIEVVARDRPSLLAAVTGALAARGVDIVDATAVTWPDGAVVESFTVHCDPATPLVAAELEREIRAAQRGPLTSEPAPDLEIAFDGEASPWYTLCEVRGPDRPGLLHTVTVGFAATGVSIHSARAASIDGFVVDRFELTDTSSCKLDREQMRAAREAIWSGAEVERRFAHGHRRRGALHKPSITRARRPTSTI